MTEQLRYAEQTIIVMQTITERADLAAVLTRSLVRSGGDPFVLYVTWQTEMPEQVRTLVPDAHMLDWTAIGKELVRIGHKALLPPLDVMLDSSARERLAGHGVTGTADAHDDLGLLSDDPQQYLVQMLDADQQPLVPGDTVVHSWLGPGCTGTVRSRRTDNPRVFDVHWHQLFGHDADLLQDFWDFEAPGHLRLQSAVDL